MQPAIPRPLLEIEYENAARQYMRKLPLEHFAETVSQANQRKTMVLSFELVHVARPEVQTFNELLIQYGMTGRGGRRNPIQVIPDNMVVIHGEAIKVDNSFNLPLQPVGPFWVFDYVSRNSKRKDYVDSFNKYEKDLKVPYYLTFQTENHELTFYRHDGTKYTAALPNEEGRYAVPELEMELALLDGWVRFWFRGELVRLPGELQKELNDTRERIREANERAAELRRQAKAARDRTKAVLQELERLRTQLAAREQP